MNELTHASFFSGVGGLDLGLEWAGWQTVSFSEIDPYAIAVLAERWPDVPNLGDIVGLAAADRLPIDGERVRRQHPDRRADGTDAGQESDGGADGLRELSGVGPSERGGGIAVDGELVHRQDDLPGDGGSRGPDLPGDDPASRREPDERQGADGRDWRDATLWSGGFPCQDLSVAGKRRGFAGERSSLAFAFLDLVERHRPRAILLENVPGLLSSHRGRDFGTLLDRLAELGYGWAYRLLDARYFGVPQRRRRVFIVAMRCEADDPSGRAAAERSAAVLSVGSRCSRHPATGVATGEGATEGAGGGAVDVGGLTARGIDKNATQNASAGHFIPTLDTSDGREGRDLPERYIVGERGGAGERAPDAGLQGSAVGRDAPRDGLTVGDDQSVARAIHASTGRRSGPAGDEVSNIVHGPPSDPSRVRAADGLAGRLDDRAHPSLRAGGHGSPGIGRDGDEERLVLEQEAFGLSSFADYAEDRVTLRANGGDVGGGSEAIVAATLNSGGNDGGFRTEPGEHLVFVKARRAQTDVDDESWREGDLMPTLNAFDTGDARTTAAIIEGVPAGTSYDGLNQKVEAGDHRSLRIGRDSSDFVVPPGGEVEDDPLLPLGLDGHRYRCCGNGVVAPVAEWLGARLAEALR